MLPGPARHRGDSADAGRGSRSAVEPGIGEEATMSERETGPIGEAARVLAHQAEAMRDVAVRLRSRLDATRWRAPSSLAARDEAEEALGRLLRCAAHFEEAACWYALAAAHVSSGTAAPSAQGPR